VALFVTGLNLIKTSSATYSVSAVLHEKDEIITVNEKKNVKKKLENGCISLPAFYKQKRIVIMKNAFNALFDYILIYTL
jgi:hypothetical protein